MEMRNFQLATGLFLSIILCLCAVTAGENDDLAPCPFSEDCSCQRDGTLYLNRGPQAQYSNVECNATLGWPIFNETIIDENDARRLKIVGNLLTIPANALRPFRYIQFLTLEHTTATGPIDWNPAAFIGVKVLRLTTINVAGLIPPQKTLETIRINSSLSRGLDTLRIRKAGEDINLNANSFKGLPTLQYLSISNTPIVSIDDLAFDGLNKLRALTLKSASLSEIPFRALAPLDGCLKTLDLSGNNINAIDLTSVNAHPKGLKRLTLDNNGLTSFPSELISRYDKLRYLSLAYNMIPTVSGALFLSSRIFSSLILNGNPLTDLNFASWPDKISELKLRETMLREIDLSSFYKKTHLKPEPWYNSRVWSLDVSNTKTLKNLWLTDRVPKLSVLKLENTGLEWIDPNVGKIYDRYWDHSAWISIKNNTNLKCSKDMIWMDTPSSQPQRVFFDGSKCKNKGVLVPLEDYLKEIMTEVREE